LNRHGVLAIWSYNLLTIKPNINAVINYLYDDVLDPYWSPERKMVEDGYKDIKFSLQEMKSPCFVMKAEWNLSQLIGYLCTWSAVRKYEKKQGTNPVEGLFEQLSNSWGDPEQKLLVEWPLAVKIWLKNT
jgi:hypothetical protein